VVINRTGRGWYSETGVHSVPMNVNYGVGDTHGPNCQTTCFSDARNFFVFDLSGISQTIVSAQLQLDVPAGGYDSPDPSENYELHDVTIPIATLLDGTGGIAAHTDLGGGVVYGNYLASFADVIARKVDIPLNSSAIAAMNATHGLFGIGG